MRKRRRGLLLTMLALVFLIAACGEEAAPQVEEPEERATEIEEVRLPETITDTAGIEFRLVPAGSFVMGSDEGSENNRPAHLVTISKPFYISTREIPRGLYHMVMIDAETEESTEVDNPDSPATNLTWHQAMAFCHKLEEVEEVEYRLPTEAEWEYAYRAGTQTLYYWGDEFSIALMAEPNALGLFAMADGVSEWCLDWYVPYTADDQTDPFAEEMVDKLKSVRGGHDGADITPRGFSHYPRRFADPDHSFYDNIGFRVVRMPQ